MDKINFANTAKLSFWDFVIDATNPEAPKLVSGDYKDLRAKIESGELIDGVAVRLETGDNGISAFRYLRLISWALADSPEFGKIVVLAVGDSGCFINENNEVLQPSSDEEHVS